MKRRLRQRFSLTSLSLRKRWTEFTLIVRE